MPDWDIQNPSVSATRATRKTTRFSVRDAKYNAAGAMHRVAWALQNSQGTGKKCEKPWENQGFAAERTGTELFDVFPMFLDVSKGRCRGIAMSGAGSRSRMTEVP
ncbi:MAG: hypothetical protein ACK449_04705 [Planctomycetota bacterium]